MPKEKSLGEEGAFRYGKHLIRAVNLFRRLGDENLSQHEITTGQLQVLSYLHRFGKEGFVYQKDLEEALCLRRSSVTSLLQNMEKNGFILREPVPEDARVKKVCMTEKGKELDASLKSFIDTLEEELMEGVTEEEKKHLRSALLKMIENLENKERKKV